MQGEHQGANRTSWTLLVPTGAALLVASAGALALTDNELGAFASGVAVTSVAWWVTTRGARAAESVARSNTLLSLDGEAMTADELDALHELGWRALHHLPVPQGHIDHVVMGPGGVFAVETTMSTSLWTLNIPDARLLDAAARTKRSAAKTRSILRSQGVAADVLPLLVLWGDAVGNAELVDGVAVVRGDEIRRWFEERSVGGFRDVARAETALMEFLAAARQ